MGHPRKPWEFTAEVEKGASKKGPRDVFSSRSKKSKSKNSGDVPEEASISKPVFWPRDFLVEDIPRAKFWTFGYDVGVIGNAFRDHNTNNVKAHARDFCNQLEREIKNKVVIFKTSNRSAIDNSRSSSPLCLLHII